MIGTTCTCGRGHLTFGACVRAKNLHVAYCQSWKNFDATRARKNEKELAEYKSARDQGIQPAGTQLKQVRHSLDMSDHLGRAYDASNLSSLIPED